MKKVNNSKNKNFRNYNPKKQRNKEATTEEFEEEDENRKKGKKVVLKIFKSIMILGLLGFGIAFLLTSPYFNISSIEIYGNTKISGTTYVKLSDLKKDTNIFRFRKSDIIANLKKNSYVENATIKRALPNKVEIHIEERKPEFIIEENNNYIYLDKNGNILEKLNEKKDLTILRGIATEDKELVVGNKLVESDIDRLQDVIKIQNSIKNNEIEKFDIIDINNKFEYIITFIKDAKEVHIGDVSDLETKILYMKHILKEQEGVPGTIYLNQLKVYFSPK